MDGTGNSRGRHTVFMDRGRAARLGQEAVEIQAAGQYTAPSGRVVEIGALVKRAAEGTETFPPDVRVSAARTGGHAARYEVTNETTMEAAWRLLGEGFKPVALNFASATHPGGGFLTGARAQEEALARSSGLYSCLNGNAMYAYHQRLRDPMYSDYVLYSPDVPFFRTDAGEPLEEPYLLSVVTSPAVMAKTVLERNPARREEIARAMWPRTLKVLGVMAEKGHDTLLLGAWGCGAFGNDGDMMAGHFRRALTENFAGAFARVVFAVLDLSPDERYLGPFRHAFADLL